MFIMGIPIPVNRCHFSEHRPWFVLILLGDGPFYPYSSALLNR